LAKETTNGVKEQKAAAGRKGGKMGDKANKAAGGTIGGKIGGRKGDKAKKAAGGKRGAAGGKSQNNHAHKVAGGKSQNNHAHKVGVWYAAHCDNLECVEKTVDGKGKLGMSKEGGRPSHHRYRCADGKMLTCGYYRDRE